MKGNDVAWLLMTLIWAYIINMDISNSVGSISPEQGLVLIVVNSTMFVMLDHIAGRCARGRNKRK